MENPYLEDSFRFLEKNKGLLVAFSLDKTIGRIN